MYLANRNQSAPVLSLGPPTPRSSSSFPAATTTNTPASLHFFSAASIYGPPAVPPSDKLMMCAPFIMAYSMASTTMENEPLPSASSTLNAIIWTSHATPTSPKSLPPLAPMMPAGKESWHIVYVVGIDCNKGFLLNA